MGTHARFRVRLIALAAAAAFAAGLAATAAAPAPQKYYRVGQLDFLDLKENTDAEKHRGKRFLNLFSNFEAAIEYFNGKRPGSEQGMIFAIDAAELRQTADGRIFLAEMEQIWRTQERPPNEVAINFTSDESYEETWKRKYRAVDTRRGGADAPASFAVDATGKRTTLNDLRAEIEDATRREVEASRRALAEGRNQPPVEVPFKVVIEPESGRMGFGPDKLTSAAIADQMHLVPEAKNRLIEGRVIQSVDTGEWILDIQKAPDGFNVKDVATWKRFFSALAARPDSLALDNIILQISTGRVPERAIDGNKWLQYDYGYVRSIEPVQRARNAEPAWKQSSESFYPRGNAPGGGGTGGDPGASGAPPPGESSPPPPLPPADPGARPAAAPGPTDPTLEESIARYLDGLSPDEIAREVEAGRFDRFRNPLFDGGDSPARRAEVIRTWKRVLSNAKYAAHSEQLARLRWAMVVDVWAQVAADHNVPIELIDSGKRVAYRSDLDVTAFAPLESRGNMSMKSLMDDFGRRFRELTGYDPGTIDVMVHDGDVFMPDPRQNGQSFEDYSRQLHDVMRQLKVKVASSGDAYVDPDANRREVQRRGFRDGRVTVLRPDVAAGVKDGRLQVRSSVHPVAELSWRPGGGWDVHASRFGSVSQVQERNAGFGIMLQNLNEMIRNGADPEAASKYFNRAINGGLGDTLANSYMDLHTSPLPGLPTPDIPGRAGDPHDVKMPPPEMIKMAFDLEAGRTLDVSLQEVRQYSPTKEFAKLRWIIRAFGLAAPAAGPSPTTTLVGAQVGPAGQYEHLGRLYRLMEISTNIEHLKNIGEFNWRDASRGRGRSRWMARYFDAAVRTVEAREPELRAKGDPAFSDAVYDEAWRVHSNEMKKVLIEGMVAAQERALSDLTPDGIRRNALRTAMPDGRLNLMAARKIALDRMQQVGELIELIDSLRGSVNERGDRALARQLAAQLLRRVPPGVRTDVRTLLQIGEAQFDAFIAENNLVGKPAEQILAFKEGLARAIREPGDAAKITDAELAEHLLKAAERRVSPPDVPLVRQVFEGAKQVGGETAAGIKANMSGLMIGNSVLNLVNAYRTGNQVAINEAWMTEMFMLLPPQYGIAPLLIKDIARGNFAAAGHTVVVLGVLHFTGLGELYLAYQLVRGVPTLAYSYVVDSMNDVLLDRAFTSRPPLGSQDGGLSQKRGLSNPVRAERKGWTGMDAPFFPVLYRYDKCGTRDVNMFAEDDDKPAEQLVEKARKVFGPAIWKQLVKDGKTPVHDDGIIDSLARFFRSEESRIKAFEEAREKLVQEYAFDLPYYQRMSKIYDCFLPLVQQQRSRSMHNEDAVLEGIFTRVVDEWLAQQHPGYASQFESTFSIVDRSRERLLKAITMKLVALYKNYEAVAADNSRRANEIQEQFADQLRRRAAVEKELLAKRRTVLARMGQGVESEITSLAGRSADLPPPVARLEAPPYYIRVELPGDRPGTEAIKGAETTNLAQGLAVEDLWATASVTADRERIPGPWRAEYHVNVDKVTREWQPLMPGFVPSRDEAALLSAGRGGEAHALFAVAMSVTADVFDAGGRRFASAPAVPVIGYTIAPVPAPSGVVHVTVKGTPPAGIGNAPVDVQIVLPGYTPAVAAGSAREPQQATATFRGIKPGRYTVQASSRTPNFGTGTASFVIEDGFSLEAFERQRREPSWRPAVETSVEITLPYTGPQPAPPKPQDATDKPAGQDASGGKPPAGPDKATDPNKPDDANKPATGGSGTKPPGPPDPPARDPRADAATFTGGTAGIDASAAACAFDQAIQQAQALLQQLAEVEPYRGQIQARLAALQQLQNAQRVANGLAERADGLGEDLETAIALLEQAVAVPGLPECARGPIAARLGPLRDRLIRRRFAGLTGSTANAANACEYERARGFIAQVEALTPRTAEMSAWLSETLAGVADGEARERNARAWIQQAQSMLASPSSDCNAAISLLIRARDSALACNAKLGIDGLLAEARQRCQAREQAPPPPPVTPPQPPVTPPVTLNPPVAPPTPPPITPPSGGGSGPATGNRDPRCADYEVALSSLRENGRQIDAELMTATDPARRDSLMRQKQYVASEFTRTMGLFYAANCHIAGGGTGTGNVTGGQTGGGTTGGGHTHGPGGEEIYGPPSKPSGMGMTGGCSGTLSATPSSGLPSTPVAISLTIDRGADLAASVRFENATCPDCVGFGGGASWRLSAFYGPRSTPGIVRTAPPPEPPPSNLPSDKPLEGSISVDLGGPKMTTTTVTAVVYTREGTELCRGSINLLYDERRPAPGFGSSGGFPGAPAPATPGGTTQGAVSAPTNCFQTCTAACAKDPKLAGGAGCATFCEPARSFDIRDGLTGRYGLMESILCMQSVGEANRKKK